ncbi:MAG TPA: histone deacetylase family protein [Burkholderiales bacterium]|nr:histone deacetylase family protein [Burkholderiales bacterium]
MTTAYVHHAECSRHDMGAHHPECPARLDAIHDHLLATGLMDHLVDVTAPLATREHLERIHDARYLDAVEKIAPHEGVVHLDPDTAMGPHSFRAALRAAGAVIKATDLVMGGEVDNAFCSVRPPGHHAERARAMGFCFFNNVAVGAAHALAAHGLERVAIADFDVHHGNGTEDIFRDDGRVLMVSTFQHPFYPYSGVDGRSARMVNIPLPAYSAGREFRAAVEDWWLPALDAFKPRLIFISAGFDAHRDDDMASLGLVEGDYRWVTEQLVALAAKHCHGRIVSTLEGGYALDALARSAAAHVRVLSGL